MANLDSRYTIEIRTQENTPIIELSGKAYGRSMRFVRNGTYEAGFSLDLDTFEDIARAISIAPSSILSAGRHGVIIRRLNTPLFGGQIAHITANLEDKRSIDIKCLGWLDLFKDRYTGPADVLGPADAGQIAWTHINTTQTKDQGSFGITQGNIQTSVSRGPLLYEYMSIKDAIQNLAERYNGFDFEFTWDKKFNVFYPSMGVQREEFELTYPGNIKNIKITTDASQLANYIIARGQGLGEGQLVDVVQDTDAKAQYKLREAVLDYSDIPDVTFLQDLAQEDLNTRKTPQEVLEITLDGNQAPNIGSYWLGDRVKVIVNDLRLYQHINTYYRIDEITITIDDEDSESVQLRLTKP